MGALRFRRNPRIRLLQGGPLRLVRSGCTGGGHPLGCGAMSGVEHDGGLTCPDIQNVPHRQPSKIMALRRRIRPRVAEQILDIVGIAGLALPDLDVDALEVKRDITELQSHR